MGLRLRRPGADHCNNGAKEEKRRNPAYHTFIIGDIRCGQNGFSVTDIILKNRIPHN
jgi:hypothetical protein